MTSRDPILYLGHIRDALAAITEYAAPGRDVFFSSRMTRDAVVRNIEIIGEAVKRLPQEVTDRAPEIPIPPAEEQTAIVLQVEKLLALADAIERRVQAAITRAEKLPQTILSKAFAGELVPTEADLARAEGRTYETAEGLLARVRTSAGANGELSPKKAARARAKPRPVREESAK
jgi:hypothetical protein